MAAAFSEVIGSGSTQGQGVKIVATATPGTLLHTTLVAAELTSVDNVTVYAFNSDTVERQLTIEFGGPTAPDQNIVCKVKPLAGLVLVVPNLPLCGNGAAALTVKAFADAANKVVCYVVVNRNTK